MTAPAPAAPGPAPYIDVHPGDLILAENVNQMQVMIKQDIAAQVAAGIKSVTNVQEAQNAETLGGETKDQLTKDIITAVLQSIPPQAGYQRHFKRLQLGVENVIKHNLMAYPLVDVYQLDYFYAVYSGEDAVEIRNVNFYLYNSYLEQKIKNPSWKADGSGVGPQSIVIEPSPPQYAYKLSFAKLVIELKIQYDPTTTLEELVGLFWRTLLNNEFTPDQYCHSPWFDRCCGEKRTVKQLQDDQDWDKLSLKVEPRRTMNFPRHQIGGGGEMTAVSAVAVPPNVEVSQYDYSTVGLRALKVYPDSTTKSGDSASQGPIYPRVASDDPTVAVTDDPPKPVASSTIVTDVGQLQDLNPPVAPDELKVMVLLFTPLPVPAPAK